VRNKIDAHVHIVPSQLLGKTDPRFGVTVEAYGIKRFADGSLYQFMPDFMADSCYPAETLLKCMDNLGIEKSIIMQSPSLPINVDVIQAVHSHPERLKGAMIIEPRDEKCLKEIEALHGRGLTVLKFEMSTGLGYSHPNMYPDLKFDSPLFQMIWAKADELGITITIDPGLIGSPGYQVAELNRMVQEFPQLRFVICHLGFPSADLKGDSIKYERWKEMTGLAKFANVWFDFSALPALFSQEDFPFPSAAMFLRKFMSEFGVNKAIWGSDVPGTLCYATYAQLSDAFEKCSLFTEKEKDLLFFQNAQQAYF
jgi:predicted TIM-barrel fold metal-dependent hydrolase